jgi:hypothetical protein
MTCSSQAALSVTVFVLATHVCVCAAGAAVGVLVGTGVSGFTGSGVSAAFGVVVVLTVGVGVVVTFFVGVGAAVTFGVAAGFFVFACAVTGAAITLVISITSVKSTAKNLFIFIKSRSLLSWVFNSVCYYLFIIQKMNHQSVILY